MTPAFVTTHEPPDSRRSKAEGGVEERLTEASVMLAVALHLLDRGHEASVSLHPDGEHAKGFDMPTWLAQAGFRRIEPLGRTDYGGVYRRGGETIRIHPKSGEGDVVGEIDGRRIVVECKGGTLNSRHPGPQSRLRRSFCEAVGLLMARPRDGSREIVAVPQTPLTLRLSGQLAPRCREAGIEIVLVRRDGTLDWIAAED